MKVIKNRKTALIGLIIAALLWSTGGMLIKMVNGHPLAISSFRTAVASLVFLSYKRFKLEKLDKTGWIMAIGYACTVIFFVLATRLSTAANAIFLQFTATIWVAVFSKFILKKALRRSDIVSMVIIFISMGLFFVNQLDVTYVIGNIFGLLAGLSFASFITIASTKKEGSGIYPVIYGSLITTIIGLPFYTKAVFEPESVMAIVLLGLFQIGLAYIIYTKSMEYVTAIDGILIPVIEPILNPVWVAITIGEIPTIFAVLGGIIMITTITIRAIWQEKIAIK